jgi:putative ABC transport system ATP-binding protein
MGIIELSGVTKTYRKDKKTADVLRRIDLSVGRGAFVVVKGASGSGKSTLLNIIGGLDTPTTGNVAVNGEQLSNMKDNELAAFRGRTMGFVFQSFYLHPYLTLRQNIELPAIFSGAGAADRAKRTRKLTELLGLSDKVDHLPSELSGGQIQRAAMLRALYNNPKIILADEPTGNLDKSSGRAVLGLLKQINDQFHTTVVLVTHDAAADEYASAIYTMK